MRCFSLARTQSTGLAILSLGVTLLLWEGASRAGLISAFMFPPPSEIFTALYELSVRGFPDGILIINHIAITLRRILLGFAVATVIAIPLGLAIGYSRVLDRLSYPIITFGRSIAAISVLPLFIAWLGIGELSKVMLIAFGAFWIILTYTISSVKLMDPLLIRVAQSMDLSTFTTFRRVVLPACTPRVFTGLRVALIACFTIIVAVEMIATVYGLGALIMEARNSFRTDITIVGMLLIGCLGFAASKLLDYCEARLLPWNQKRGIET